MRIEKLNENKIRIFFNIQDLQEKNIDLHTFMSNSIQSQDLFLEILNQAETEVGFRTQNHKLVIEALASMDGNFILTITKIIPKISLSTTNSQFKIKRKTIVPNKKLSIYEFNTFEDFCEYCNSINSNKYINAINESSLIFFKKKYFLIIKNLRLNAIDLRNFSYKIIEFALRVKNEELMEKYLKEHGNTIIHKNAITTCLKYFRI